MTLCQVVSISAFEAHSGSTSHHPSDNIYLENGKNLRDILSAGQEAADCGDNIFRALKHAIGEIQGIVKRTIVCAKCGSCEGGNLISCKGARCSVVYHPGMCDFQICLSSLVGVLVAAQSRLLLDSDYTEGLLVP